MSIPKVLGTISFTEQIWWLLLNYVLLSERICKKKVSGEIASDVITLFYLQIQEPTRLSSTTIAFVFPAKFYYHKIFEFETRSR